MEEPVTEQAEPKIEEKSATDAIAANGICAVCGRALKAEQG